MSLIGLASPLSKNISRNSVFKHDGYLANLGTDTTIQQRFKTAILDLYKPQEINGAVTLTL